MKRVIEILILTICLCFITACGNGSGAAEETTKGTAATEQSTGTKEAQTNPDHIKKELCDNVTVDAKIIIPDGYSGKAPVYDASVVYYDKEKVCKALNIDFSSFTRVADGLFKKDDNTFLRFGDSISGGFSFSTEIRKIYANYNPYEKNEISGCGEDKELDFMSKQEAIDKVQAVLTDIGIDNSRLLHIYALPVEYHQYKENEYAKGGYLSEDEKLGDRWNDYGGCYELVFTTELNRIPLTEFGYVAADDSGYKGCEISVLYSADGIQDISASNRYRADESSAENKVLLSVDEMLEHLKNKFESVILTENYEIKEIKLCYFPQIIDRKEGKFRLIPVWQIIINYDEYGCLRYRFNAVDGTEL